MNSCHRLGYSVIMINTVNLINKMVVTPLGLRVNRLVSQGDVHLARIEAQGQRFSVGDRRMIAQALKKWNVSPVTFFS